MAAEAVLQSDAIVRALQGAFGRGARRQELLKIAATRIHAAGSPYTGVYLYMLHDGELVLEAHQGRPTAHARIPVGTGLCGKAVAEGRDINEADVASAPGYLACSRETKSELIVLIRRHDHVLGQIDIDSDVPAGFTDAEHAAVKEIADALAVLL
ncbi:MAG: GAF domain-containing protein [Gemmatimonadetes bacterium]|nr:GAF domain-containing protein [Gemmatimonadota bacterium]MBI2537731.1 GAF domain-containing protein [Gemmatimonadota bacterium]MBI2616478.1 GAF domain-containing protein [Gemmatimonadota bacterium]